MSAEIVLMWGAVSIYAVSAVMFVAGAVFRRAVVTTAGFWVAMVGLVPHAIAIGIRWVRVGHGPYLGFYEAVSSFAFVSVVVLGLLVWRYRSLVHAGVVLMPLSFLMLGGAMLTSKTDLAVTGALASWWLTIHVAFAKIAYGAFVASFVLGIMYLARERARGLLAEVLERMPKQDVVDDLGFRFAAVGFVFWGIMIVSGAIWANEAWGRYWAWDPIEVWSLIAWCVYALYLHTRLTLGWRGRRSAQFAIVALPVMVFSLVGVPLVYDSIHAAYLLGY